MKKSFIVLLTLLLAASAAGATDKITTVQRPTGLPSFVGYVPDRLIVVMQPDAGKLNMQMAANAVVHIGEPDFDKISDRFALSSIVKQFPGTEPGPLSKTAELAKYYKIEFESGTLEEAMEAYYSHPMVERVEPIGIHAMYATPSDFYYSYQWHLNQASDHDIDAPEAWDIETGSTSTIVAILDSGTRYYHPDLGGVNASPSNPGASRGNMWINNAELNGSAGVDDDGNGYVDDWIGYDFIQSTTSCWSGEDCNTKDNDPRDFNGHGTHTSGIFGMITNDGYGMCGVAGGWGNGSQTEYGNGVNIMALRMGYSYNYFGQEYGVVLMDAAAEAFYYAADNGAKIASCSWGSSNTGGIGAAATYFLNAGGIICVAAGNDGAEVSPDYLNGRGDCISVAATNESDNGASFTTYGTWVDICAPGNNIYSTYHDHTDPNTTYWAAMSGTSMATPMTAGVCALIWSHNPSWTATQVRNQLYSSADNIDAYLSSKYIGKMGAGRINAYNAVNTGPPPPPVANFSGSPTSGTAPLTVNFTDLSTGSITSWSWTFGDGGTSTAQNPSHQYTSAGTYTVSLTVVGPGGSDGETKNNYITVNPCVTPTAGFVGSPTSGDYPLTVYFTDQSSNATSWNWNFGDGGTSTAQNPSHTYTAAGTFTVTQTVTNSCGSDQLVRTNYITVTTPPCNPPVADFVGSPTSGDYPLTVNFTDLSTNSPTSWSWNFGDAGTSTAQNPSHTYTSAGTYTVTLTATNSCGSDGETKTNYITVTEPSGWAVITYDDFENGMGNYTDGGGDMSRYTGGTYAHQGSSAADIQDNSGTASSFYHTSTYDVSGFTEMEVEFWFIAISMENNEDFFVEYYNGSSWQTVADLNAGLDFVNNTFYNIVVTISSSSYNFPTNARLRFRCDASNNSDDVYIDEIEWRGMSVPMPPVADFSGTPTSGTAPLLVSFTDLSTNNPTGWSWTFGDGGTSTAQNPSHTYNDAGTYTVSLTATNAFGSDNETKTGYITVNPPGAWTVITYDDFESGLGSYTDGGGDCSRYTGGTYAHQGNAAMDIQDNSGTASSFYHTASYNVTGYTELEVEFWFRAVSMENNEDFWLQYYNGSSWQTVATWASGVDFQNNNFYHEVVAISSSQYSFPTNARLRFMCDASGNTDDVYIDEIEFRGMSGTSGLAKTNSMIPEKFALSQNYPNPFNPTTEIAFTLSQASHVTLEIYNILGQRVVTLVNDYREVGTYTVTWDASNQSSGIYFYRIATSSGTVAKKMVLLK